MTKYLLAVVLVGASAAAALAANQSAPLARDLVAALEAASLDSIAAADPMEEGRFVAALHVPGQLLVISAKHPSMTAIAQRITAGLYRDVYLDLQGTPTAEGKFFVQDTGEDGIVNAPRGQGSIDVVYRDGKTTIVFNGDARAQGMNGAEYDKALDQADADYARALGVLKSAIDARGK